MAENANSASAQDASNRKPAGAGPSVDAAKKAASPKQNQALRMLGLPNWRPKLPSRNWMIFWTIIGSWTGAYFWDRRQKRKAQEKWCTLVSHVAHQSLSPNTLPRRITIFLAAPPGDGLRSTREHFVEYVKPILVAGALDWEVVEGRREGEVRAGLAEKIRRLRKTNGEPSETPITQDVKLAIEGVRLRAGVMECEELQGDIVIGRHTWKEYIRGLHEGWLGPIDEPKPAAVEKPVSTDSITEVSSPSPSPTPETPAALRSDPVSSLDSLLADGEKQPESSESAPETEEPEEEEKKEDTPPPKPKVKPAYNTPDTYTESQLPPSTPRAFQPISTIQFPHLLGFFNTPIRMYRFLNQRYVADDIGRQTAALVLAHYRPYQQPTFSTQAGNGETDEWEQQSVLRFEEKNWHKKSIKREPEDGERVWIDEMVIDPRIGDRMRRFEVDAIDEERARRIAAGDAGIGGRPVHRDEEQDS